MKFGSLFAGIGGFDLGLERGTHKSVWQVEIDNYCNEVLTKHWPKVKRFRDVKEVGSRELEPVDLICGGFPCQDLSVAGRRAGLDGERSGLWHEFHRIITELSPRWVLIENVPGLLSISEGRDLAAILNALGKFGYGFAWRVFDAQYFRVAQRRRRVFIVGHLGNARRAAEILFEPESVSGDSPPSREAGSGPTPILEAGARAGSKFDKRDGTGVGQPGDPMFSLQSGKQHAVASYSTPGLGHYREGPGTIRSKGGDCGGGSENLVAAPLTSGSHPNSNAPGRHHEDDFNIIPWHENQAGEFQVDPDGIAKALKAEASHSYQGVGVRRLMPIECERLQGFPDNWTHGKDSPRYRALGNAVAVPVSEWIGNRFRVEREK